MNVLIGGENYRYCDDLLNENTLCRSFDALAHRVFGIRFEWWRQAGLWGGAYRPHVLAKDGDVVACVAQNRIAFCTGGQTKNTVQLGTVMTDPAFRGRGLAAWLTHRVLDGLPADTHLVYLYANDGARDFYPQFGFAAAQEWAFCLPAPDALSGRASPAPAQAAQQAARRLDLENADDLALLHRAAAQGNPCADPAMLGNPGLTLFHCLSWLREDLYFLPAQDAVAAVQREGGALHCLEVLGPPGVDLGAVLAALCGPGMQDGVQSIELGFAPAADAHGAAVPARPLAQPDTTFMVLQGGEDFVAAGRVRLPELSRA